MIPYHGENEYTLRFEVILQYSEYYPLRDAWLSEMASDPRASSRFEWRDGRERYVVRTKFRTATLVVSPHEWGVEYVISFAFGVASGVVANVIYDLLKAHAPHYRKILKSITPSKPDDIRIDINIGSPNGPVKIGSIKRNRPSTYISATKLKIIIDDIEMMQGRQPASRASKKRKGR
jgi:hypothetical protein